jgi:tryptophan 2,3-dioxygenase
MWDLRRKNERIIKKMENVKKINMYPFPTSSHIVYEREGGGGAGGGEYLHTFLTSAVHADETTNIQ